MVPTSEWCHPIFSSRKEDQVCQRRRTFRCKVKLKYGCPDRLLRPRFPTQLSPPRSGRRTRTGQHDDMRVGVPRSLKAIKFAWVAVVLLFEVVIFIDASARCQWPDPAVRTFSHPFYSPLSPSPSLSLAPLCGRSLKKNVVRVKERRRLTSSSSPILRFSTRGLTRSEARS
jgi:hypothetical protein